MVITVLHHADADGFGAAYAVFKGIVVANVQAEVCLIPVQYDQPVPEIPEGTERLAIVDFSYDTETLIALAEKYLLTVVDHHKTAKAGLLEFAERVGDRATVAFSDFKSGAVLAWETFMEGYPVPPILEYVQDRDLWRFALPDSEVVNLCIAALPWDLEVWDSFDLSLAKVAGEGIKSFQEKQIEGALRMARLVAFLGYEVPVANCSANISEVGQALLRAYPDAPFSVTYCDRADGVRTFSLRSRGDFDVSDLCRARGGGGHKAAAGFSQLYCEVS